MISLGVYLQLKGGKDTETRIMTLGIFLRLAFHDVDSYEADTGNVFSLKHLETNSKINGEHKQTFFFFLKSTKLNNFPSNKIGLYAIVKKSKVLNVNFYMIIVRTVR